MNGLVLMGGALAVFIVAALGIVASAIAMFRMTGMAMNPKRPVAQRRVRGALAALSFGGIIASAVAGYVGIATLLYFGMTSVA